MAATTRTLKALLRIATLKEVAKAFSVSPSMVARWKKKLPAPRQIEVRKALDAAKKRETELRRELRSSNSEAIALRHGVTQATARNWKRAGLVTPKMRAGVDMLEALLPQEPLPRRLKTEFREFRGRLTTRGISLTAQVGAYLSPRLARIIERWFIAANKKDRLLDPHGEKTYQCTIKGEGPQELGLDSGADAGFKTSKETQLKPGESHPRLESPGDLASFVLDAPAFKRFEHALIHLTEQLEAIDGYGVYVEMLIFWVRMPLGKKEPRKRGKRTRGKR